MWSSWPVVWLRIYQVMPLRSAFSPACSRSSANYHDRVWFHQRPGLSPRWPTPTSRSKGKTSIQKTLPVILTILPLRLIDWSSLSDCARLMPFSKWRLLRGYKSCHWPSSWPTWLVIHGEYFTIKSRIKSWRIIGIWLSTVVVRSVMSSSFFTSSTDLSTFVRIKPLTK